MATDTQSMKIIGAWLTRLAGFTKAANDKAMTKETMADLAIMLGKEFPSSAFTSDSLQAIAGEIEWFPAYSTLRAGVAIWWADHRPQQRKLAGPPGNETLGGMDAYWFRFWHKRVAEIEAGHAEDEHGRPLDPFVGRGSAEAARRNLASLVREKSPAAWRIISGSDDRRKEPTQTNIDAVAASVKAALAELSLRGATTARSSAPLGEQIAAVRAAMGAAKPFGQLTPEELAAARAAQLKPAAPPVERDWVPE